MVPHGAYTGVHLNRHMPTYVTAHLVAHIRHPVPHVPQCVGSYGLECCGLHSSAHLIRSSHSRYSESHLKLT